jgi:hypothetical protein
MKLNSALLILILSLSSISCQLFPQVPEFPEVVQYGVYANVNPPGFYGVNNKTKERVYKAFDDPSMKGAQALSADDYKKVSEWEASVVDLASKRCH